MKIIHQTDTPHFSLKSSNLFISRKWLRVISKTYGIQLSFVTDDIDFFLPVCLIKDQFFTSVKSIPFCDYTLNNFNKRKLDAALQLLRNTYPTCYIETSVVQNATPIIKGFTSKKVGFLNRIDIKSWKEGIMQNKTYERNIKSALNYGLTVKHSNNSDSLNNFYKLHEQLRIRKFHKLPQPFQFFTILYEEFIASNQGFFLEAWNKDILIASWVILIHEKTLYYKLGASDLNYLRLRPNDLLLRHLMQYGHDNGFKTVDLGFSGATKSYEGLIRFKNKEGGEKAPIFRIEYYPEKFNEQLLIDKIQSHQDITNRALASGNLNIIRETSNRFYHNFA